MHLSFTDGMTRLAHRSWEHVNARLRILATREESAYYAWVDEYVDRLHAEAQRGRPVRRVVPMAPIDDADAS
jgi:hypothetical protein